MTTKPDVPDRAVEAVQEALTEKYGKVVAASLNDCAIMVLEAAAPHIIEQFIDDARSKYIISPNAADAMKRLILTPEGKKK